MKYLSVDTETGGLGDEVSLLTVGLVLADKDFNQIQAIQFGTKPDNGKYIVEAAGLAVNKINLVEHEYNSEPYKKTGSDLYTILNSWSKSGKEKLVPIGKQLAGDIRKIQQCLLSKNTWEQFVSYRQLDVSAVFMFMQNLGYFPETMNGSLKELLQYYMLKTDGQHDALWDAKATLEVLKKMKGTMMNHAQIIKIPEYRNPFGSGHEKLGL